MTYNNQFQVIEKSNDLTGLIGVTATKATDANAGTYAFSHDAGTIKYGYISEEGMLNHVYVSTNTDSSTTVESTTFKDKYTKQQYSGIRRNDILDYNQNHQQIYLQLELLKDRETDK